MVVEGCVNAPNADFCPAGWLVIGACPLKPANPGAGGADLSPGALCVCPKAPKEGLASVLFVDGCGVAAC